MKVISIPTSALTLTELLVVNKSLKSHGWVLAVVDDGTVEYQITTMQQIAAGQTVVDPKIVPLLLALIKFDVPYCLLLNPADGSDFNILTGLNAKLMVLPSAVLMKNPSKSRAMFLATYLLQLISAEKKKTILASELITGFDAQRQPDELLLLDSIDDITKILAQGTDVFSDPAVSHDVLRDPGLAQDKATFKYDQGNFNSLFSYDVVVASCLKMTSLPEISVFVDALLKIGGISTAAGNSIDDDDSYSADVDFKKHVFTQGTRREGRPEEVGSFDGDGVVVAAELGGFAESDAADVANRRAYSLDMATQHRILLVPFSLVSNQQSFKDKIRDLGAAAWKIVVVNDSDLDLSRAMANFFVQGCDNVLVVMSNISSDPVSFCFCVAEHKLSRFSGWIDAVRLWVNDPKAIKGLPLQEGPELKTVDGQLTFTPYEQSGVRRSQDQDLKPAKVAGLSYGRVEELTLSVVENPCDPLLVAENVYTGFLHSFVSLFSQASTMVYHGLNYYGVSGSGSGLYSELVVDYDCSKTTIIQTINSEDEIDLIVRNMGREENMQCPDTQARYLIVPLRLLQNSWLDMAGLSTTSKLMLGNSGPLNVGGWRLVVVFDSVFNPNHGDFYEKVIKPLVIPGGIVSMVSFSWSIVDPARGFYFGINASGDGSLTNKIELQNQSIDSILSLIKEQQSTQNKYVWADVQKSLI